MTNRARRGFTLATGALMLGACQRPAAGPVELRLWAMGREGEVVKDLLADFERANPDIRIRVQQLPWTAAQEKLLTAFAGDVTPDLCQLGNTWLPQFAALGALVPLGERMRAANAAGQGVAADDYFPGIWASNQLDGEMYGVPWYVDTRLIYYRKDLLAKVGFRAPPVSWAEWTRAMQALKLRDPANFGVLLPINEYEQLLALALQQEAPLLRDGGRYGNFRSPDFRRTLHFYTNLFNKGWAPRVSATQISNVWDEFDKGYFSFHITGPWNIGEFKRRLPPERQDIWMTAPLPGPNGPGASIAGGASLVMFKRSRHPAEAWRVITYLSRPEVQRRFYEMTGNLPPRRSAWSGSALETEPYAAAFRDQLERAVSPPKVPEWERIALEMQLIAEKVVAGQVSLDDGLADLDARTDRILEKRRWMLDKKGGA